MLSISDGHFKLSYKMFNDVIYFKAKEIATTLGYSGSNKAIIAHVDNEYKSKFDNISGGGEMEALDYNDRNTIYITEPGLYQLIFKSHLPNAKGFTKWVFEEVLPTIRSSGSYTIPKTIKNQIILKNESDLPYKVIGLIRRNILNW